MSQIGTRWGSRLAVSGSVKTCLVHRSSNLTRASEDFDRHKCLTQMRRGRSRRRRVPGLVTWSARARRRSSTQRQPWLRFWTTLTLLWISFIPRSLCDIDWICMVSAINPSTARTVHRTCFLKRFGYRLLFEHPRFSSRHRWPWLVAKRLLAHPRRTAKRSMPGSRRSTTAT